MTLDPVSPYPSDAPTVRRNWRRAKRQRQQEWLHDCALRWLDTRYLLVWQRRDASAGDFTGFTVYSLGTQRVMATVTLGDAS